MPPGVGAMTAGISVGSSAVRVDREVDRPAVGNRREHGLHAFGVDLLGADEVRAEGARGLALPARRALPMARSPICVMPETALTLLAHCSGLE